jgi:phosphatidylglycerophosphatase A
MSTSTGDAVASTIATWFGCGWAPKGPGTVGSLGALALVAVAMYLGPWTGLHCLVLAALWLVPAIWASSRMVETSGSKDPQFVVVDEVVGQWISLGGAARLNWKSLLAGFVLFRLFDIWKPWPARALEKLPRGYGIVMDDVMAGVYAALVLFLAGWFNLY